MIFKLVIESLKLNFKLYFSGFKNLNFLQKQDRVANCNLIHFVYKIKTELLTAIVALICLQIFIESMKLDFKSYFPGFINLNFYKAYSGLLIATP